MHAGRRLLQSVCKFVGGGAQKAIWADAEELACLAGGDGVVKICAVLHLVSYYVVTSAHRGLHFLGIALRSRSSTRVHPGLPGYAMPLTVTR